MDAGARPALERFTRLACAMVNAPIAVVSLVDDHRQYFAAMQGVTGWAAEAPETPLSHSFCRHVVSDGILDVPARWSIRSCATTSPSPTWMCAPTSASRS